MLQMIRKDTIKRGRWNTVLQYSSLLLQRQPGFGVGMEKLLSFLRFPGVYAIYISGELFYIGQGINISQRLMIHLSLVDGSFLPLRSYFPRDPITEFQITIKVRPDKRRSERLMVEDRLIGRLKPKANYGRLKNKNTLKQFVCIEASKLLKCPDCGALYEEEAWKSLSFEEFHSSIHRE